MDKNSVENEILDDEVTATKGEKKRISYVSRTHKAMVAFVVDIYRNLGHADYHNNKAIAAIHQLSPDSIKQQLTSCQQYGLLKLKFGTGYKITDLFNRINLADNENKKLTAVVESLKTPDTYQLLFKEYEYHILPPVSGVKNHFIRNFQFNENIATKASEIFIENLKDYGLLDARGVLVSDMVLKTGAHAANNSKVDENKTEQEAPKGADNTPSPPIPPPLPPPSQKNEEDLFELPIPLPNKRRAYLKYPVNDLTKKDIKVITKALEFIASSLDGDDDDFMK